MLFTRMKQEPVESMEPSEHSPQSGFNQAPKRPITPEEQSLIDEFAELSSKYGEQFPNIIKYVQKESERIQKGYKSAEEERLLDIEAGKPMRLTYKVSIPTEKYPNFNYVGRLLGPKGSTLKGMQEISGCKLAVLGKGSMRDKDKEETCRLEGGKYAHLNEELHVWLQAFGTPDMVFYKLYVACKELKKYLHADYNDDIFNEQMMILEQEGGLPKGFTAARAAPRGARGGNPRGMMQGRGGMSGRGGMMGNMGRGGMHGRGGGMSRGGMRGRGMSRGGMRGGRGGMMRGGASSSVNPETLYEDVYEPVNQSFNSTSGFENGSSANQNAYFEEFPEPGADQSMMGSSYRQTQDSYNDDMGAGMGMNRGGSGMGGGGMMGQGMNMQQNAGGMGMGGGMSGGMGGGMGGNNMSSMGGRMGGNMSSMGGQMGGGMGGMNSGMRGMGGGGGMDSGMRGMGGGMDSGMRGMGGGMDSGMGMGGQQKDMGMSGGMPSNSREFQNMKRGMMGSDMDTASPAKFVRRY